MNSLLSLYPGDDAVRLAASVAVQIAGVVLLALAAAWTVARRNAALRHGIWLAALAWVCVAPVAAWGLQRAGITIARWHWPAKSASAGPHTAMGNAHHLDSGDEAQLSVVRTEQPRRSTPLPEGTGRAQRAPRSPVQLEPQAADATAFKAAFGALTAVWITGALLLLARLVWGLRVVASIWRELIPFGDLPGEVADRLRRTLGVKVLPPIMLSRRVSGPATIGLRRPIVVLPAELPAAMSASELHDALAHECAHALRRDTRIALMQQLVAALYWLHPLVHVLNRQLARAREETCDNVVLSGTTAADYARTLLSLSQTMHSARGRIAVVQMFDKRWRLAHRVEGLLNTRRIVMTRMNRRAVALLAAAALALGTTLAAISTAGDQAEDAKSNVKAGLIKTGAGSNALEDVDVRAAIAAADVAKYLYLKNKEAYDTVKNSIPLVEVKRLESAYQLAVLQVEQAERRANKLDTAGDQTDDATTKPNAALNESGVASDANEDLDVRIAKAAADVAKYTYLKNKEAYDKVKDSVPLAEVRRLESAYKLAVLKAEQAAQRANRRNTDPKTSGRDEAADGVKPARGKYTILAQNLAREDEDWLSNSFHNPLFEERKAELDVREASAVLQGKQSELKRVLAKASQAEAENAKLAVEVAEVQLERAQLGLEQAQASSDKVLGSAFIAFPGPDPAWSKLTPRRDGAMLPGPFYDHIPIARMTLKRFLEQGDLDVAKTETMRVALIRFKGTLRETLSAADQLKPTDGALARDVLEGKADNHVLHHGDFIIVMRAPAQTPPPRVEKPKEAPKLQPGNGPGIDGNGTLIIHEGDDLPPVRVAGESDGAFAARWYIERIDKAVNLTDDQRKVITQIVEAHAKTQQDWLEKNAEKLKAAQEVWMDAIKNQGQEAVAKAQKNREDALAPMLAAEKKEQQALGAVLTPAQRAKLREHEIATWLGWIVGPVKLSEEQRTKFREALNEVKDVDYETWERTGGFVVEKIVTERILTPEQKRTIFKHDAMEAIKLSLPGADLTPEQLKRVEAAADDLVKDQTPKLDGSSKAAAANKIVDSARALLTDEQKQKVQAALNAQSNRP
jgi:beta-lactamase regulating signal transducer with metallopeptidase domain